MSAHGFFSHPTPKSYLIQLGFAVTVVWLTAALVALLLRRSPAAMRHRIWGLSTLGVLLAPALVAIVPQWRLGIIRSTPPEHVQTISPVPIAVLPDVRPIVGRPSVPTPIREAAEPDVASAPVIRDVHPAEVAAPASIRPVSQHRWGLLLAIGWLLIACALMLRQIIGIVAACNLVRRASRAGPPVVNLIRTVSAGLGLRAPRVCISDRILSPICFGWIRPCIVLPTESADWSQEKLAGVLTHELAHVARRDVVWQMLARLAAAIYWPHPMAWVAAWRMRVERELACDDWVLRTGQAPTHYARWLLDLAAVMSGRPHAFPAGVAMAAGRNFQGRVSAILDSKRRRSPVSRRAAAMLSVAAIMALMLAVIVSPLSRSRAAERRSSPTATTQSAASLDDHLARGIVVDEAGKPLGGAEMSVDNGKESSTQTDAEGRFSLHFSSKLPARVTFQVSASGGERLGYLAVRLPRDLPKLADLRLTAAPPRRIDVTVRNRQDQPVPAANVVVYSDFQIVAEGQSDASGAARLRVASNLPLQDVFAFKEGVGLDYVAFWGKDEPHNNPYRLEQNFTGPIHLVLNGAKAITVKVVDDQGKPLSGVMVHPWYFDKPNRGDILNMGVKPFGRLTDAQGVATFSMIPADNDQLLQFWTTLDGYFAPNRCLWDPKSNQTFLETTLLRVVRVMGRVIDQAGQPVAGASVRAGGADFGLDEFNAKAETAADGTFEMQVNPDMFYAMRASKGSLVSAKFTGMIRKDGSPAPIVLTLAPGIRVHGTVTQGPGKTPVPGEYVSLVERESDAYYKLPKDQQLPGGTTNRKVICPFLSQQTRGDEQGRYEFYTGPGDYYLDCMIGGLRVSPNFVLTSEKDRQIDLHDNHVGDTAPTFSGRVVLKSDPSHGVPEAKLDSQATELDGMVDPEGVADHDGKFTLRAPRFDTYLHATSRDGTLQGILRIKPTERNVTVPVEPTTTASGRLLDSDGRPAPGKTLTYGYRIDMKGGTFGERFGGTTQTDANGNFTLRGLIPGYSYTLNVVTGTDENEMPNQWRTIDTVKAENAQPIQMGDRTIPAETHLAPADFARDAFVRTGTIEQRMDKALHSARFGFNNVLVILGAPHRPVCRELRVPLFAR